MCISYFNMHVYGLFMNFLLAYMNNEWVHNWYDFIPMFHFIHFYGENYNALVTGW